eukprot:jgi/Undpi1/5202/HiC_scaffold_2.g00484.m1
MQRRVVRRDDSKKSDGGGAGGSSAGSLRQLKRLDIYSRPKMEFQRGTVHGAVVTLVLTAAVVALTWRELVFSMTTETVENLFVNSTISPTVNVTFDLVFARIPCAMISLDAEDASGIPQSNLRHDVIRTRLDLEGRALDRGEKHDMGNTLKEVIKKEAESDDSSKDGKATRVKSTGGGVEEDECNCFGAGYEGECCRTCEDVKAAYRRKGWKLDASAVPSCSGRTNQASLEAGIGQKGITKGEAVESEGCQLKGSLEVSRTEGNFHFAPGYRLHRHATDMSFMDRIQVALETFNTTHTINTLTFGEQPPKGHASAKHEAASTVLEGHHKTVQDTHAMHQYFLQLVPTVYRFTDGATVRSNQYSATEHLKHVHSGPSAGLPGVYFYYEVSPVQALVEEKRRGFLSFLTGACGVVGGVYTILGLVNAGINGLLSGKGSHRSR